MKDLEGGCACGTVRYRLTDAPMFVHCCHCSCCQTETGSAFVLNALIESDRVETLKGVASGPVYNIGSLGNGKGDTYPPIEFRGGEYAEVYVEAKAATNLNLAIYDNKGRLVCSDTDISHIAYCGWTPASAGTFTLKVDNKGPVGADYALMTN